MLNKHAQRLFVFGCSFTKYRWAMYGELLAHELKVPFYNYGMPMSGNSYIFNMLVQANQIYKFNKDDLVIVQWSTIEREDRYINNHISCPDGWFHAGAIHTMFTDLFDEHFIQNCDNAVHYMMSTFAMIQAADAILTATGSQFEMLQMPDLSEQFFIGVDPDEDKENAIRLVALYKNVLNKINPGFYEVLWNSKFHCENKIASIKKIHKQCNDLHPLPHENAIYVNTIFDNILSDKTIKLAENTSKEIIDYRWYDQYIGKQRMVREELLDKYDINFCTLSDKMVISTRDNVIKN